MFALALALVLSQAAPPQASGAASSRTEGEDPVSPEAGARNTDGGVLDERLVEAQAAIDAMRDVLRAVEHGLQEANALGDTRAFNCVKTGHLALQHQVESAEQWQVLLRDAVGQGDDALAARQLDRIGDSKLEVQRRAAELATCKLAVEPPAPVVNRTWFGCHDAPSSAENPAWRRCEKRRTSVATFGLEGLLVAIPVASLVAVNQRGVDLAEYGGLALESGAGGLVGGLALFAVSGALALAVTQGLASENAGRAAPIVGAFTMLGIGAGSVAGMAIARPVAGAGSVLASIAGYAVIAAISTLLIIVHDHFAVAPGDEAVLAEQTFGVAPALMAVAGLLTVPAMWSLFARE
ncbi:MAG: hypothetical protein JNK82_33200 [Myxococcaceae bacterium]|nr:hypothetical protein [Myxococcaceae bacterium]